MRLTAPQASAYFPGLARFRKELMSDIENKLVDKRVAARYLKKGLVDEKDYERYLKSLADLAGEAVPVQSVMEHVESGEEKKGGSKG